MADPRAALAAGLAVLALAVAVAVAVVLSHSPSVLAGANATHPVNIPLGSVPGAGRACQANETLPAGTTAIAVSLEASAGPRVALTALAGKTVVARGESASGWIGTAVAIPVEPLARTARHVTVCVAFTGANERVSFLGVRGPAARDARSDAVVLAGRMTIEYLRPGPSSWWASALPVARRMGLGRAWAGAWVAVLAATLMAIGIAAASWLTLRGSVPAAAWLCALIACLNAAAWSFITPPFQIPDEQAHFAYVEELARTQRLPSRSTQEFASDEAQALLDLEAWRVNLQPEQRPIATRAAQAKLERDLAAGAARSSAGVGAAGVAASEPPLYYALEAIPYELGAGGGVLDQLQLMRLMSALMAGVSALFVFLFVRELLPSTPRAWVTAGVAVAFLPMLGFISGAVNPDALLCAVSSATVYCLSRGFRRGLTPRLAIAIGALAAAGFLTKLNFLGLAPGVLLGLALLTRRASRSLGARGAARVLAPALVLAAAPVCAYVAINLLSDHRALGIASGAIASRASHRSLLGEASYIWQLYLPRLPGMHIDFPDISPIRNLWFDGLVGDYGFEDTFFPRWVDNLALIPAVAILALAARELYARRATLRPRLGELGVYLAIAAGLLVLIGASSYLSFPAEAAGFPEPRYLLPLTPLFGGVLALAARGAGRRWAASAGVLIVVLFIAHDLFSQLQTIGRYYG